MKPAIAIYLPHRSLLPHPTTDDFLEQVALLAPLSSGDWFSPLAIPDCSLIWRAICRQLAQSIVQTFFDGVVLKKRRISSEQDEIAPGETGGFGCRKVGDGDEPIDVLEPRRAKSIVIRGTGMLPPPVSGDR